MRRLLMVVAAVALVAAACSGGGSDNGSDTTAPPSGGGDGGGIAAEGERLFGETCATCHGADAQGIDGLGPALQGNAFVAANNDGQMFAFIKVGRSTSDPDNTTGVDMPAKGGNPSLDDQDLADIVAFRRTLQN